MPKKKEKIDAIAYDPVRKQAAIRLAQIIGQTATLEAAYAGVGSGFRRGREPLSAFKDRILR